MSPTLMPRPEPVVMDGCEAAAHVAYRCSEVIALYPITPSSPMGEYCDEWADKGHTNLWGTVPRLVEMQSEGGAAGAMHGALLSGSLATTFTASQGLLLMLPNMFKIAGELLPNVIHVAARTVAAQSLSIFGDHSDIMAARTTGYSILVSNTVQEAMDMALVAHAATLRARVPFMHAFDGFRTSHEIMKIEPLPDSVIEDILDHEALAAHRRRGLNPDHPVLRGSAANPDTYFQAREACNPFYFALPEIVQQIMDSLARRTGRAYKLFDYEGPENAEHVIIMMGSGSETAAETARHLNAAGGRPCGVLKVRLFRPFSAAHLVAALPQTVRSIAVLDRTKEPGAAGEPLYQDVITALAEGVAAGKIKSMPRVIGGRYGLSSKEFDPAMARAVFQELDRESPKNHFTIGIRDDVTHTSLPWDPTFSTEDASTTRAVFWGLGADGTVGANKNTIKIIGERTDLHCQGYFVYDSKKAGAHTISHLRFGPNPIRQPYLIAEANFLAVHQFPFLDRYPVLDRAARGAVVLLNCPHPAESAWDHLPGPVRKTILERNLKVFVIDAYQVARQCGLGGRINTVMQTCFFALSRVIPFQQAVTAIKEAIDKTYGKRGPEVVSRNHAAVETALAHLHELTVPTHNEGGADLIPMIPDAAPAFLRDVTAVMLRGEGDQLPVSALPPDGCWPTSTTRWEKRRIATEAPVWHEDLCIQCGKCVIVCPHSVIRGKIFEPDKAATLPSGFAHIPAKWRQFEDHRFSIQVSLEDCTGCTLCVTACPAVDKKDPSRKSLMMTPIEGRLESGREQWDAFLALPDETGVRPAASHEESAKLTIKDAMLRQPTFEFSSACAGCGETPYLRTLSQLFGDRAVIANATGCSSIYGGNLPTTPWSVDRHGRGPAWANSLFEDNAEFGLGIRLALDHQAAHALALLEKLTPRLPQDLVAAVLAGSQDTHEAGIAAQRERVADLKSALAAIPGDPDAATLLELSDNLVRRSVWIVGGDGWAYDIGFGGLDHVIASGADVNILVLDTEVYSNTGGQASKSTPLGTTAKFAASGKPTYKKDLGLHAMSYQNVYVAQVAMGANDTHTLRAFAEAEAYRGPSIIMAYSPCVAHGMDMARSLDQTKLAVQSGHWLLYRYTPADNRRGMGVFKLDSKAPSIPLAEYHKNEARFNLLAKTNPEAAAEYLARAQTAVLERRKRYESLAGFSKEQNPAG